MIQWIKDMYYKFEETVNYLFFGGLAFLVNMVAYYLAARVLGVTNDKVDLVLLATGFAWVVAVLFAFWTNRCFVFKSKARGIEAVSKEFFTFVGARVVTGLLEMLIMYLMVDLMNVHNFIAKIICNIIVIISNYIFSKLWVFKAKA